MKRFAIALVLTCALSGVALAGDIPSSGIVSPPPPPPEEEVQYGEIHSTDSTSPEESTYLALLLTALGVVF